MFLRNLLSVITFILGLSVVTLVHGQENNLFDTAVKTMDGQSLSLKEYVGKKPVYLKFWATWCVPCREQMPHLQETYESFGDDVEVMAVNIDVNDSAEAIRATQLEFSLTVPILIDDSGKLAQAAGLVGTPYHLLIDIDGNVVFKGHEASAQLDKTIRLLAASNSVSLPAVSIDQRLEKTSLIESKPLTALFFTATWCDWYFEESRPVMSQNCVAGQQQANALYKETVDLNWLGVTSHLWTGDKELGDYRDKYQIEYPMLVDSNDQEFVRYQVKDFPTLILLRDGKEVFRTSDFSNEKRVADAVLQLK
mgnify:CR=1 FL=1